jgi:hypothetical protein
MNGDIRGATDLSIANLHPRRERYEVFQTRVEISRRGQTVDGRISGTRGERAYFRPAANVGSLRVSDLMFDRCQDEIPLIRPFMNEIILTSRIFQ